MSPHPTSTNQEDENTEFYRAALHELISLGTNLARTIQAATVEPEAAALTLPEAAAAFERTSRARRPESETDALQAEFHERLDSPDLLDEIDTRPVPEIIADILRDLDLAAPPGMPRPWRRRTPADLTHLLARAAQPQTPQHQPTPRETQHPPWQTRPDSPPAPPPMNEWAKFMGGTCFCSAPPLLNSAL